MLNSKFITALFVVTSISLSSLLYANDSQNEYYKFKALQAANQPVNIEVVEVSERFINTCSVVSEANVVASDNPDNPLRAVYRMPQECMDDQTACRCSASTRDQICVFECTAGL